MTNGYNLGNIIIDYETAQDIGLIDFRVGEDTRHEKYCCKGPDEMLRFPGDRLIEVQNQIEMTRKNIL